MTDLHLVEPEFSFDDLDLQCRIDIAISSTLGICEQLADEVTDGRGCGIKAAALAASTHEMLKTLRRLRAALKVAHS